MNIKDFIHLYLGCEVYVFPDETLTNGWLETKRKEMPGLTYKYQLTISNYNVVLDAGYKPILRPLSDMTEEEISHKESILKETDNLAVHEQHLAEMFQYMLSRGFDLFGLINNRLAISKTVFDVPNKE